MTTHSGNTTTTSTSKNVIIERRHSKLSILFGIIGSLGTIIALFAVIIYTGRFLESSDVVRVTQQEVLKQIKINGETVSNIKNTQQIKNLLDSVDRQERKMWEVGTTKRIDFLEKRMTRLDYKHSLPPLDYNEKLNYKEEGFKYQSERIVQ